MELTQLKYFVAIAETLSFTRAAELVHVSQPALSYQIRHLEDELGTRLFERKGRRIDLTPDGEVFLPLAQAVLFGADEAVRALQEHLGFEADEIRLGCNPSVATYLVPGVLASFRADFPRVRVEVVEGGDLELQQSVHTGSLDFAIVTAPGSPHTLEVTPLGAEDLGLIACPSHWCADRASIDLNELADDDFVLATYAYNLTVQIIDACRRAGFEPKVAYQAGSIGAVKNLVREGLGVSILPGIALKGLGKEGLATVGLENGLTRDLNLIQGKNRSYTRAARELISRVSDSVMEHMKYPPPGDTTSADPLDGTRARSATGAKLH